MIIDQMLLSFRQIQSLIVRNVDVVFDVEMLFDQINADKVAIRASGLAYATLLATVPLVAVLFAFSTMISWSYYGERAWLFLFGDRSLLPYQIVFLGFTFGGVIFQDAKVVLDFGDLMILGMAFPNIAGVLFLASQVKAFLICSRW